MTQVVFRFVDPDGTPRADTLFDIVLRRPGFVDVQDSVVMPKTYQATTDLNGEFTLELEPATAPYRITLIDPERDEDSCGGRVSYQFYVPDSVDPVQAQDLFIAPPPNDVPWDEAALLKLTEAVEDAEQSAIASEASAVRAENAASDIEDYYDATVIKAGEAADSAAASEASAVNSQASAVAAGLSEAAAADHETAAGLSATASADSAAASQASAVASEASNQASLTAANLSSGFADAAGDHADTSLAASVASENSAQAAGVQAGLSEDSAVASAASATASEASYVASAASAGAAETARAAAVVAQNAAEGFAADAEAVTAGLTPRVDALETDVSTLQADVIAAQADADAGIAAAAVADAKAVVADGKAVTADAKAVTADGKAVAAQATANAAIPLTQKGADNGVAPLVAGLVPSAHLPSYVDDVIEYANLAAFPVTGETGKIYIALDTNRQYRWGGSSYTQLVASPGTTDNVVEGSTNLYFTVARVLATVLTGLSVATGGNAVSTDTVLVAFGKMENRLRNLGVPITSVVDSTTDFDTLITPGWQAGLYGAVSESRNPNHPDAANAQAIGNGVTNYYWLHVTKHGNNVLQMAYPYVSSADTTNVRPVFRVLGSGAWSAWKTITVNPMTAPGDLIVGGLLGNPKRLAIGTVGFVLKNVAGVITWAAAGLNIQLAGYNELLETVAGNEFNVSTSNVKKKVMTVAATFTITGATAGNCHSFTLYLEAAATYAPTWPASVKWLGGAPSYTAKDRIVFETIDNGATWFATYAGSYV